MTSHATDFTNDYREAWDRSDVKALLRYVDRGWTLQEIADHMGRTRSGVASKLFRLRREDI